MDESQKSLHQHKRVLVIERNRFKREQGCPLQMKSLHQLFHRFNYIFRGFEEREVIGRQAIKNTLSKSDSALSEDQRTKKETPPSLQLGNQPYAREEGKTVWQWS